MKVIPEHPFDPECSYLAAGNCYWCCETCNIDRHVCYGCGEPLDHNGRLRSGEPNPCYQDESPTSPGEPQLEETDVLVARLLIPALGQPDLAASLRQFAALVEASTPGVETDRTTEEWLQQLSRWPQGDGATRPKRLDICIRPRSREVHDRMRELIMGFDTEEVQFHLWSSEVDLH